MKTCMGCKYADWRKTVSGKLHPSGDGKCLYKYKLPPLPASRYWISEHVPSGGFINRHEQLEDHYVYYGRAHRDKP